MALQPFVGSWPLLQFRYLFYTDGRTPWTSDEPVARPLPTHRTTQTQNKRTHRHPCLDVVCCVSPLIFQASEITLLSVYPSVSDRMSVRSFIHSFIHSFVHSSMALQPFVGSWPLLQFRNLFYTDGRTPWTSDHPVAKPLPTHRTTQNRINAHTQTSTP
jgi:hypothetical protein